MAHKLMDLLDVALQSTGFRNVSQKQSSLL